MRLWTFGQREQVIVPVAICVGSQMPWTTVRWIHDGDPRPMTCCINNVKSVTGVDVRDDLLPRVLPTATTAATQMRNVFVAAIAIWLCDARHLVVGHACSAPYFFRLEVPRPDSLALATGARFSPLATR